MRLLALTTGDVVLWGAATAVAALMMAGMLNRRRAHLTEVLRTHVRRQQHPSGREDPAADAENPQG